MCISETFLPAVGFVSYLLVIFVLTTLGTFFCFLVVGYSTVHNKGVKYFFCRNVKCGYNIDHAVFFLFCERIHKQYVQCTVFLVSNV